MGTKILALVTFNESGKTLKRENVELHFCSNMNPQLLEIMLPTKWKTKFQSINITKRRLLKLLGY